jgi:hypothetical protein
MESGDPMANQNQPTDGVAKRATELRIGGRMSLNESRRIELTRCDNIAEHATVLILRDRSPLFTGGPDGNDWLCPNCKFLLAAKVVDQQILGVVVQCPMCEQLSFAPSRNSGQPIVARSGTLPPGWIPIEKPIELTDFGNMLVGRSELNAYNREVGIDPPGEDSADSIEPEVFRALGNRLKQLLGENYNKLAARHARGKVSATPAKERFRAIELIEFSESTATLLDRRTTHVPLNGDLMAELFGVVHVFDRWQHHPRWPQLVKSLASRTELQHDTILLTLAGALADIGNGVGIVDAKPGHKHPDIWIDLDLRNRAHIEVKVPKALRGPLAEPLTIDAAVALWSKHLSSVASVRDGQLQSGGTGILALGGFHLGAGTFETLIAAAEVVLSKQTSGKPHVYGLSLVELTYQLVNNGFGFLPISRHQTVEHPDYQGQISFQRRDTGR